MLCHRSLLLFDRFGVPAFTGGPASPSWVSVLLLIARFGRPGSQAAPHMRLGSRSGGGPSPRRDRLCFHPHPPPRAA